MWIVLNNYIKHLVTLLTSEFLLTALFTCIDVIRDRSELCLDAVKCRDCVQAADMCRYVAIAFMLVNYIAGAPPPLRLTIDCSDERVPYGSAFRSSDYNRDSRLDVHSFCNLIHNAFPKTVQDGRFILIEPDDLTGFSDTQVPISISPPAGFLPEIPNLKVPKLRIPTLKVPKLEERKGPYTPPRIGSPMTSTSIMRLGEESSAEKMEKFKKGVQKMLHVVKVLGQIDQYLSERTRIIVDKLTKTLLNSTQ